MKKVVFLSIIMLCQCIIFESLSADIVETFNCGDDCTATLDSDGVFIISGTGKMDDYIRDSDGVQIKQLPWQEYIEEIKTVKFAEDSTITNIGSCAFCRAINLTSATIPNVTVLGRSAFNQTGLISIDLPNIIEIGTRAFFNTHSLIYANFSENVAVGEDAFNNSRIPDCGTRGFCNSCSNKGQVYWEDKCLDEYPFAKKRWTPAEANEWLHDGNDNFVIITFKK